MPGFLFSHSFHGMFHEILMTEAHPRFTLGRDPEADLLLPDPRVSRIHAIVCLDQKGPLLEDRSRNGTLINGAPVRQAILRDKDQIQIGRFLLTFVETSAGKSRPVPQDTQPQQPCPLIGEDASFLRLLRQGEIAAQTNLPLLLLGETGTGKELIARFLHERSGRSSHPFVAVNCAALQPTLLESELFGHERGAFTGAVTRRSGLFEATQDGTLFLDEIGEMPLEFQPKLLRVLETRTIHRVGSHMEVPFLGRLIAATNRPLAAEVAKGRFRADLFHRLDVMTLHIPPLRQRQGDIPALCSHILQTAGIPKTISPEALAALCRRAWPGNIRELRNILLKAAILTAGEEIHLADLPFGPEMAPLSSALETTPLAVWERDLIHEHLRSHQWNRLQAAKTLGISRSTLYLKMQKYGLV